MASFHQNSWPLTAINYLKIFLSKFTYSVIFRMLGKVQTRQLLEKYLRYGGAPVRDIYHSVNGILKWKSFDESGEAFLVREVLAHSLKEKATPCIFDVGANKGAYARLLLQHFQTPILFLFEPNPACFELLEKSELSLSCGLYHLGLSDTTSGSKLYTNSADPTSEHASGNSEILQQLMSQDSIQELDIKVMTLDAFCKEQGIAQIDFLKIDTEGHELAILKGANQMISQHAIRFIQFEFNEMNVHNRIFLKDFYECLPGYRFYRLDTNRLIPLYEYDAANEIFQFQNLLAVHPAEKNV